MEAESDTYEFESDETEDDADKFSQEDIDALKKQIDDLEDQVAKFKQKDENRQQKLETIKSLKDKINALTDAITGKRKGLKAFEDCYSLFGYYPKTLIAPVFCENTAIVSEMNVICNKIRAIGIVDAPVGTTVQEAITGRGSQGTINFNTSSERIILCYPHLKVYDTETDTIKLQPYSQRLAGVIAAKDIEKGYHWSPSNTEITPTIPFALIRKRIKEASNRSMVIGGNITTNINETYNGNKVMAAYGLQDKMYDYFEKQTWDGYNVGMSLYKRSGWMSPMMYLIASFGIAIVLGFGTYLINSGQMTAGSFASFVTSLLLLYKPVKTLGNTLTGIQGIFVAMGRVFELFDLKPEIVDSPNARELQGLNSSIKFEDVNFEYIPNQPVLKNLNLTVAKNETLAIVGNSGGGKSTLVNLIPRFYDIKSGHIKIDDVDIREYTIDSLRQNISMVFQDNFLYSGTIRENIMMGNFNATEEDLQKAIYSAHLQEMIKELPQGLETMLGERGLTLSGGQRQRVAIARAMLRNAPIVILDEATSALDNESEAIVQKAMDNLMKDRTVFIIAHRLSTIKNADRIAVINEGELVELGTHDELMNIKNGQYKALYEMQFKKQEVSVV